MSRKDFEKVFKGKFSEKEEKTMLDHLTYKTIKSNNLVFAPGDDSFGALKVISGVLRVYVSSESGREITLFKLNKNDPYFISTSLHDEIGNFDINIIAETNAEVSYISKSIFKNILDNNAELKIITYEHMLVRMSDVLHEYEKRVFTKVETRIAELILRLSKEQKSKTIKITQEDIAKSINSVRVVVTRTLNKIRSEGIISLRRGSIVINDQERLEMLLD